MSYFFVASCETGFPARLRSIPSPPAGLWIRGRPAALLESSTRALAVVGCRAASRDGLELARTMADTLARAGVVIISGLARGIDAAAHRATLDAGGATVAVLGSGLDRLYPAEHRDLAEAITRAGAVVSEYPPATAPHPGLFPRRNRLIAGLADAVLVVEAPEKSGALITASAALDQGKDVLVAPGRVAGGRNRGGHGLIRDGATLVETAEEVLQAMGWEVPAGSTRAGEVSGAHGLEFTVEDVARELGQPTATVLAHLLELELEGKIQRIGLGRFVRVRGPMLT